MGCKVNLIILTNIITKYYVIKMLYSISGSKDLFCELSVIYTDTFISYIFLTVILKGINEIFKVVVYFCLLSNTKVFLNGFILTFCQFLKLIILN